MFNSNKRSSSNRRKLNLQRNDQARQHRSKIPNMTRTMHHKRLWSSGVHTIADSGRNPAPVSIAHLSIRAMAIQRTALAVIIVAIMRRKHPLISFSNRSLMSQDVRRMMICGEQRSNLVSIYAAWNGVKDYAHRQASGGFAAVVKGSNLLLLVI